MSSPIRKRGWNDFWHGSAVGSALAVAGAAALGKKDVDKKAIYDIHYGNPPPFVSGQYRQVRAANQQNRLQKRIHWGHALAGAATGALVTLGRDDEKVKSQEAERMISEPWGLNPGFPSSFNRRTPWKKVGEPWFVDHGFHV